MHPNNSPLPQDTASKFFRVAMTEDENKQALQVSPLFLAYLQNKIEAYANELVSTRLPYHADPTQQVEAILTYENLRVRVDAYEELMSEIIAAQQQ